MILLALLGCHPLEVEVDVPLDICRVVSSEPIDAVQGVAELVPPVLDTSRLGVVPLVEASRWATLRGSYVLDPNAPTYHIEREAPSDGGPCPAVTRSPILGVLAVDDGTAVYHVSGWIQTTGSAEGGQLESFRLGGKDEGGDDADVEAAQQALQELVQPVVLELRPAIDTSRLSEISSQVYYRGNASTGEIGLTVKFMQWDNYEHFFEGPLLSGSWLAPD